MPEPERGTVLVIDDQPESVEAIAEALGPLGYGVWRAYNGEEGLRLAHDHPDVILLDVVMPGMDGFEVCRRLKKHEDTRLVPVVFLTGLDSRQARLQGLEAGATDFLSKPSDLVELEVRVRNLVNLRRLTKDLDEAEKMLFAIARTVEARDEATGTHCERLALLAGQLGERLGLRGDATRTLKRAGYLHDIGKIGIPDAVLLKPDDLDSGEWQVMRNHVEIGVAICSPLRTLHSVLPIIRHHHERQDGSGYPDGLRGEQVPMLARIFQVVDVFDALTNNRPYRRALPADRALKILREEVGRGWWTAAAVDELAALVEA
jgi:putative two-component system response regulator